MVVRSGSCSAAPPPPTQLDLELDLELDLDLFDREYSELLRSKKLTLDSMEMSSMNGKGLCAPG